MSKEETIEDPEESAPPEPKVKAKKQKSLLPGYLQAVLAAAQLVVVVMAIVVFLLSVLSGASPLVVLLRTGTATLVTGGLLWLVCWRIIRGSIDSIHEMRQALSETAQDAQSSVEVKV